MDKTEAQNWNPIAGFDCKPHQGYDSEQVPNQKSRTLPNARFCPTCDSLFLILLYKDKWTNLQSGTVNCSQYQDNFTGIEVNFGRKSPEAVSKVNVFR